MFDHLEKGKQGAISCKWHLCLLRAVPAESTSMFPIHERVTLTHRRRSAAPAVIYWIRNAGKLDDAAAVVHLPLAFVLPFQTRSPTSGGKTHTL